MTSRTIVLLAILVCSIALSACGGPRVRYDQAPDTSLAGFVDQGWQWQQPTWPNSVNSTGDSDANVDAAETAQRQRFENAIATALTALGSEQKTDSPWLIALELGDRQRITSSGSSMTFGMGVGRRGRHGGVGLSNTADVTDYDERTLSMIISKAKLSAKKLSAKTMLTNQHSSGRAAPAWSQNAKNPEGYNKEANRAAEALAKTLREKTAVGDEAKPLQ